MFGSCQGVLTESGSLAIVDGRLHSTAGWRLQSIFVSGPPIGLIDTTSIKTMHIQNPIVRFACLSIVTALVTAPAPAGAQEADTARALRVSANVGFLDASGNTDVTTLNVGEKLEWTRPRFLWQQSFEAINGTTDGEESANLLAARLRGDWTPPGRLSVYSLLGYDRNRFAGIGRRFEEGAGLSYRLVEQARHLLTTELGSQLVQQRSTTGVSDEFLAGRGAALYRFTFRESSYFEAQGEYLPNFETSEDYRLNTDLSLVAPLSRNLGIKLGYVVRFDNLPQPGAEKTDRFLTTGLQVSY